MTGWSERSVLGGALATPRLERDSVVDVFDEESATDLERRVGVTDGDSRVQAMVAWYAPTDLASVQGQMSEHATVRQHTPASPETRLLGGSDEPEGHLFEQVSPSNHSSISAAPILLIHGMPTLWFPFSKARASMTIAKVGADSKLIPTPGAGRCLAGVGTKPDIDATADELVRRLRPR